MEHIDLGVAATAKASNLSIILSLCMFFYGKCLFKIYVVAVVVKNDKYAV